MLPRRTILCVLALGALLSASARSSAGTAPSDPRDAKIDSWLLGRLHQESTAPFLVRFDTAESLRPGLEAASRSAEPPRAVRDFLRNRAQAAQEATRAWLAKRGIPFRPLWVVNALRVEGGLAMARELSSRPEVRTIVGDPWVRGIEAWPEKTEGGTEAVEWGISAIRAPLVWLFDEARGTGVVVASADTGVEWSHPAIRSKYRGWNGTTASHDFNWFDAIDGIAAPLDDHDHGTHTTGTMVGDDGLGNQVGVAPGARWIACRNMDAGVGAPSTYLGCIQYFLAPWPFGGDPETDGDPSRAPDIINNSWGCPPSEGCDPDTLHDAFAAVEAAGILSVVSAGNSGSSCSTVTDPPAIYAEALVVGSTTSSGGLSSFSSRGPVTVDGSGRMRPDLSAPGSSVRSSVRGGGYGTFSGTSMAGPHVAGAAALLWSARPWLRDNLPLTKCVLTRAAGPVSGVTQTCGGTGPTARPNNMAGWGLLDIYGTLHLAPNADGDAIGDACDCAPTEQGAFAAPREVRGLVADADRATWRWQPLAAEAGNGTVYDVLRGDLETLRSVGTIADAACLATGIAAATVTDGSDPLAGSGYYFLVGGRNACGGGGWGADSAGTPRIGATCP